MLFNSIEFFLFFPLVFCLYWFILQKSIKLQNLFILIASYFFYGWWDWRFLGLIIISSASDYCIGIVLSKSEEHLKRKLYLAFSLILNLGLLMVFKYYNFFIDSFHDLLGLFNYQADFTALNILLPVGISFYTFQTLSYSIDIYRRQLEPEKDLVAFFAFVSFFPQLVAGPIERASNLLPQFSKTRHFDFYKCVIASRQILWGFFKKVVVADNLSLFVDAIFNSSSELSGMILVVGAIMFSFQIYCDFSGYSDIAIGTARLLGFELKKNFDFPYFSRNIGEFWRRWHISLSTWFRDYLYIPLGGSKVGEFKKIRNILIIFLVSGFWHGANWTFVFWGLIHALLFIPLSIRSLNRKYLDFPEVSHFKDSLEMVFSILLNFSFVTMAWVFFRADTIESAFSYLKNVIYKSELSLKEHIANFSLDISLFYYSILMTLVLIIFEWYNRVNEHGLMKISKRMEVRFSVYIILSILVIDNFHGQKSFIYFQF